MNGILFKPDMIKAIIEGRKTVTRRLSGLKEINNQPDLWYLVASLGGKFYFSQKYDKEPIEDITVKPRYHVGETVFIREAWRTLKYYESYPPNNIPSDTSIDFKDSQSIYPWGRWRSPLHLPARFARYFIQILDVSAGRLQKITEEDAIKEGFGDLGIIPANTAMLLTGTNNLDDAAKVLTISQFADYWNSINPKYTYSMNPWGIRYEFKYLKELEETK
jgi:hypothetical protein